MPQSVPKCLFPGSREVQSLRFVDPLQSPPPATWVSLATVLLLFHVTSAEPSEIVTPLLFWQIDTLAPTEGQRLHRFQFHKSELLWIARSCHRNFIVSHIFVWTKSSLWVNMLRQYLRLWWFWCSLDSLNIILCARATIIGEQLGLRQKTRKSLFMTSLADFALAPHPNVFSSLEHLDARSRMSALKSEQHHFF